MEPAAAENDDKNTPTYVVINYIAIAAHFITAVVQMILYLPKDPSEFSYTQSYLKWGRVKNETVCEGAVFNTTDDKFCIEPVMERMCKEDESGLECGVDLGWLIISFFLLSFVFQGIAALTDFVEDGVCGYKYSEKIEEGLNPLRFLEYSISASVMLVAIAVLNGVFDINLVASIAVLTCSCQLSGLVVEYFIKDDKDNLALLAHLNGWLTLACAYGIILHAFLTAAEEGATQPPDFVRFIVYMLCALYCCFGITQITELWCRCRCSLLPKVLRKCCKTSCDCLCLNCSCGPKSGYKCCNRTCCKQIKCREKITEDTEDTRRCNPECKELSYVILSLAAKSVLGWAIYSNVLIAPRS